MTKISQFKQRKVEAQGRPLGLNSRADLEKRAREIALIAGRTDVQPDDLEQARAEFANANLPAATTEDAESMRSLSRDPSDPASNRGHQVPEYVESDEETAVERLALEGVEEAQHEQMVESRNNIDEPLRSRPRKAKKQD